MNGKSNWEQFFDAHAPFYDQNVFTKNTRREVDFLVEELDIAPGAAVIDVGCGTGRHAVELAGRGCRVTGLDLSERMLALAAEKAAAAGVEVEWVQADASRFSLAKRFDAALCLCEGSFGLLGAGDDPLEHPAAILGNISACLNPGARALFTVLNGAAMIRRCSRKDVEAGRFDPLSMSEATDVAPGKGLPPLAVRERAFVPTELALLFRLAGLPVLNMWGGTAGNWKRRKIDLDEIEIMVVAGKAELPGGKETSLHTSL
jgi:SAM-dependent methyltransferase